MLYHGIPHKCLDDIIFSWDEPSASRRIAIDGHVLLALESVDVVDCVLFTGRNVHTTTVVGCEASLFGSDLTRVLDCCKDLSISQVGVDECLLGDVVESARCENAPVKIARCFMDINIETWFRDGSHT
jgi:hypothetical protein